MPDPMTLEETIREAAELVEMTNGTFETAMLHWLTTLKAENAALMSLLRIVHRADRERVRTVGVNDAVIEATTKKRGRAMAERADIEEVKRLRESYLTGAGISRDETYRNALARAFWLLVPEVERLRRLELAALSLKRSRDRYGCVTGGEGEVVGRFVCAAGGAERMSAKDYWKDQFEWAREQMRSMQSERDAAVAAKETTAARELANAEACERNRADAHRLARQLSAHRAVVEAARNLFVDDEGAVKLEEALRALDAGEGPRPNEQTDIGSLAEHVSEQLAKANDECEQLRVQLEALMERSEKLRLALIKRGTWGDGEGITCPVCEFEWNVCHPEKHSKECLAAPQKGPGE